MPLVSQEIDNLLGGVSQKAVHQRNPNQVEEEVNGLLTIGSGNAKRPPSQHSSVVSAVPTAAYNAVHTHVISRSATDRYRVVLSNGDLKLFDGLTGAELTVDFPDGKGYLTTTDPARDFRCVTIGDYTYIVNGSVTIAKAATASAAPLNEALIVVRQADYNTTFSVTIDSVTVTHTTPDGSTPATMKDDIATDKIALALKTLIDAHAGLSAFNDCVQYGSTLYIRRTDAADFTISATDGIADEAIVAIKGSVPRFDVLPERARHGFIVEVIGDPSNAFDNYFVKYDANLTPNAVGVWKETVKPGVLTALSPATMPHQLTQGDIEYKGVVSAGVPGAALVTGSGTLTLLVDFEPDMTYPATYSPILQLNATPSIFTVLATDQTGAQLAVTMTALINATGAYTATNVAGTGRITIVSNPAGTIINAYEIGVWDNTYKLYAPELALVVNALVGKTIRNTSDGSSGVVTVNTATTIQVGSLTGGGANRFRKDDLIDIVGTTTNFVFGEAPWKTRKAGSNETIPFPSFVGKKVTELFYYKQRLGLVSQNRVVTSRVSDYMNLFRQTATQLLDSDPIDVTASSNKVADFHSASHWNETLYLWSTDAQSLFTGGDTLTPETVRMPSKTDYVSSPRLRPLVAGESIFFARGKGSSTQVHEYRIAESQDTTAIARDLTKNIPTYIVGTPIQLAGDATLGFLAVLTDADQSKLYVYSYHYEAQTLVHSAWSRWEFAAGTRIVSIDVIDSKLGMVVSRPGGVYLEVIDLDPAADNSSIYAVRSLDRRVKGNAPGLVSSYLAPDVSWTLPYSIAVDGSEGSLVVARISTGQIVPSTRTGPTNVTVSGLGDIRSDCYIGVLYTWRARLSTIMKRSVNRDGQTFVDTRGRLIIRYITLKFHDTTDFITTVTLAGRAAVAYTFRNAAGAPVPNGLRVPVQSRNINATIELSDTSPGVVSLDGLAWEGNHEKLSTTV